jgi:GNAT superfamily N-acetyltransferase
LIGPSWKRGTCSFGRTKITVDAAEAHAWGLVDHVVLPDEVVPRALALAAEIAALAPAAVQGMRVAFELLLRNRAALLPEDAARPYLDAGMHPVQDIVVMRLPLRRRHRLLSAEDAGAVELRTGSLADVPAVTEVDVAAFDEFWAYDPAMIAGYTARERLGLAVLGGEVVGYTLCTVRREEGSLGRLAVRPDVQGRGIGALLLEDALAYLERDGAVRVTLCTQADNVRSRRLYRQAGFEDVPGTLLGLLTDQL